MWAGGVEEGIPGLTVEERLEPPYMAVFADLVRQEYSGAICAVTLICLLPAALHRLVVQGAALIITEQIGVFVEQEENMFYGATMVAFDLSLNDSRQLR